MGLVQVGSIYVNEAKLTGVSDVQEVSPPGGGSATFNFSIFLEGSKTAVVTNDGGQAASLHRQVVGKIPPSFRFSGGGVTLAYTAVNSIGEITSDPTSNNPRAAGFTVQMDGVTVNLQYASTDDAENSRNELIRKING